jgi:hypothetical protein
MEMGERIDGSHKQNKIIPYIMRTVNSTLFLDAKYNFNH